MLLRLIKLFREEDGPTAVEYAVMLALIIILCASTIGSIGSNAYQSLWKIVETLE